MDKAQENNDKTLEGYFLDRHPEIRTKVIHNLNFQEWKGKLRKVKIDNELFYVRGGDMLHDYDQIIFEWAFNQGMITKEQASRLGEDY